MKNIIVVANWKSYKTPEETKTWMEEFAKIASAKGKNITSEVILCVPFVDLPVAQEFLSSISTSLHFFLGAQNISPFEEGPYTGEVTAKMIKDLSLYVMIGHSERRSHFKEDNEMVNEKIKIAQKYGLKPIVCVSEIAQVENIKIAFPDFNGIILFEPLFAIGSGQTDSPENANETAKKIKEILPLAKVIYGGSVKPKNVSPFLSQVNLDGVAVGGASLNPSSFWEIVQYAAG